MARARDVIADLSKVPRCAFCGGRSPDAIWLGHKTVGVCVDCSRTVLPKPQAHALANRMPPQRDTLERVISDYLDRIELEFRRTMEHNISRVFEELREAHLGGVN